MARILIVEDELALRRVITLNLVRRGHTVAEADNAVSANEACAVSMAPFDLILLDINLPDQTGWDVLRNLEACGLPAVAGGNLPDASDDRDTTGPQIIVMTAVPPQQSRLDEFKPAAVLLKPFPIAALLQLVERVLKHTPSEPSLDDEAGETSDDLESHQTGV